MRYFIFNLIDGDREHAVSLLHGKRWAIDGGERHCDALTPGDPVLVFVALTREFVGHAELETAFVDRLAQDPAIRGLTGEVMLREVEEWANGVPLALAVQRIDPTATNPYVQANAAGFRAGVVQITASEYHMVMALHDEAR